MFLKREMTNDYPAMPYVAQDFAALYGKGEGSSRKNSPDEPNHPAPPPSPCPEKIKRYRFLILSGLANLSFTSLTVFIFSVLAIATAPPCFQLKYSWIYGGIFLISITLLIIKLIEKEKIVIDPYKKMEVASDVLFTIPQRKEFHSSH